MPRPTRGPRLGGGPAHERLMLNNLASSLFTHKAITTTQTKAKRMQPVAEKLVSLAKRGDLHARRQTMADITDKNVVHELFANIAPLVQDRNGGYTRITKLGFRKGDNAPMALIELVLEPVVAKPARAKAKLTNAVKATASAAVVEEVVEEAAEHSEPETVVDENIVEEAPAEVVDAPAEAVAEESPVAEEVVEAPAEPAAEEAPAEVAEEAPATEEVASEEAEVILEGPETPAEEEAAVAEAQAEAGETPEADQAK